jgi:hypothetical protein
LFSKSAFTAAADARNIGRVIHHPVIWRGNDSGCVSWALTVAVWLLGISWTYGFVAYNDHEPGPDTHVNTTTYGANSVASGLLKDIATGEFTTVTLTTSASDVSYESQTGVPADGTDAALLFGGYVDFSTGHPHSLALSGNRTYTHHFSGLDSSRRYDFAGTAVRGNTGYTDRWTLVTLQGAVSFRPAHSTGLGVVTTGLASNQVAIWTGENHRPDQGFIARWTDIDPGSDGTFEVISTQYLGPTPGVGTGNSSSGSKGYGLNGIRLADVAVAGQPALQVQPAEEIQATSALIRGQVTDTGVDTPRITVYCGRTNAASDKSQWEITRDLGPQTGAFSVALIGLHPGATYFYRALASNSVAEVWSGPALTFRTLIDLPEIENLPATNVMAFSAIMGARVTYTGGEAPAITFYYGTTDGGTATNAWDHAVQTASASGDTWLLLSELTQHTVYYFRVYAQNSRGGNWAPNSGLFSTLIVEPPVLENLPATQIAQFSARVNGRISQTGGDIPLVTLYYGKTDGGNDPSAWEHSLSLGKREGDFSWVISELDYDTTYYFRARAENYAGVVWAAPSLSFRTLTVLPPVVQTDPPINLGADFAVLRGQVIDTGGEAPHIILFYGTDDGATAKESWQHALNLGVQTNAFSQYVRNLTPETTYFYRLLGTNHAGEAWASQTRSFRTLPFTQSTLVINEIHYAPLLKTSPSEFVELYNTAEISVDVSDWYFSSGINFTFPPGSILESGAYYVVAQDAAEFFRVFGRDSDGVWAAGSRLANEGDTLTLRNAGGDKVDEVQYQSHFPWPVRAYRGGSSMELLNPLFDNNLGGSWRSSESSPTPGKRNSMFRDNDLPALRQVIHTPQNPTSQDSVLISVKATDSDGIAHVTLDYQMVEPGDYINLSDPRYPTNWHSAPMSDNGGGGDWVAGDSVYSITMPASAHHRRQLVRYRISATDQLGNTVTAPYADDPQPNFAYFVYDGVPSWTASARPGATSTVTYDSNLTNLLPIYHLLTTRSAHEESQSIPDAKGGQYWGSDYLWQGTLVYDGTVYDHIRFRARGGVWRYSMGKNMWKFDFNRGHEFQARDDYGKPYKITWSKLNFSALIQQGNFGQRGEQGLFEASGFKLHNLADNEACNTHFVHFRIIENASETGPTASQFDDDFQGLYLAIEQPDGRFLDEHGLPDGNLYKMEGGGTLNNQGPTQPSDGSDLRAFMTYTSGGKNVDWWKQNLDLDSYYSFHSIMMAIHDYDKHAGKNYFYFHNPDTGKWSVHTWDLDLTWTTTYDGGGGQGPLNSYLFGVPEFNLGYRNRMREIRDLLFNPEQTGMLLDEIARIIYTPGQLSFVDADRAMWDYNPILISGYVNSSKAGQGHYYEATGARNFGAMLALEKNYIVSRSQWIDSSILIDSSQIPATPVLTYRGGEGYPLDDLRFETSAFSSPATNTFAALKWRIARVTHPLDPQFDPTQPRHYEITATWESAEISQFSASFQMPMDSLKAGLTYRVRARMKDNAGRWSHWSAPIQFVAGNPTTLDVLQTNLVITEIMYSPAGSSAEEAALGYAGTDFEFIELRNRGASTLDLTNVRFTKGIDFDFAGGAITRLDPGRYVLVVRNQAAFAYRYGAGLPIAGEYKNANENKLDNDGELIKLTFGNGTAIQEFTYDDMDPWPESPANAGYSLTLRNPYGGPLDPNEATNWIASSRLGGTPGRADNLLAEWKARYFDPLEPNYEAVSADDADPDGDGLPNLWEYAFGSNPRQADSNRRPYATLVRQAGEDFLTLSYRRRSQDESLVYVIQVSEDLIHWETTQDFSLESETIDPENNQIQMVTLRQIAPVQSQSMRFIRLRIQSP